MDYNSLSDDDLIALSQKNYEALSDDGLLFLSKNKTKRKTTGGENFGIGLGNAGATVAKGLGLIGGGVAAQFDQDTADAIFKGADEISQNIRDYWTPKDAEQDFGGKVASMVTTLPAQLAAMPFSPADTGTEMLTAGETLPKALAGTATDTVGNVAGVAIPGGFGGSLLKKFVTGAGSNAAQDTAVRLGITGMADTKKIQEQFAPTAETAGLAAVLGGPMGMLTPNAAPKQATPTPKPEPTPDMRDPSVETGLLEQGRTAAQNDLTVQQELLGKITDRIAEGDASKETIAALAEVEAVVKHHMDEVSAYDAILSGKADKTAGRAADAINARQAEIDARQARTQGGGSPYARELSPIEDAPFPDRVPEGWEETIDKATGEITNTPTQPKQSPHEVALERIGEATGDLALAAKRLQEAQEKLDNLPKTEYKDDAPGSRYSSLKEALETEIKAYTEIIGGKQPDLTSFKPVDETPLPKIEDVPPWEGPDLLGNATKAAIEAPTIPKQEAGLPEVPPHVLEADAAMREQQQKSEPIEAGPLERLPDEAYARDMEAKPRYEQEFQMPTKTMKPLGAYRWFKNQLNNVDTKLERVNKQLNEQDTSQQAALNPDAPPGMTRETELLAQKENLERAKAHVERIIDNIKKTSPDVMKQVQDANDKAVPLAAVIAEPVQPVKHASVDDLLAATKDANGYWTENTMRDLDVNQQHFTKYGSDIRVDNRIPKPVQDILTKLLHLTKFWDEKVYFILDNKIDAGGRQQHFGNSTIIALNPAKIAENLVGNRKMAGFIKYMGDGKITTALKTFHTVRYLTHELGHALLNKYLRDSVTHTDDIIALSKSFEEYAKKNGFKVNSVFDIYKQADRIQYQTAFHEFFAERVANQLMHKHVLGAFAKNSKYIASIGKLINNSIAFLTSPANKIDINKADFATKILDDIMNDSKDVIAATSKRAAVDIKMLQNHEYIAKVQRVNPLAFPFYTKTMEDVRSLLQAVPGMVHGGTKFDDIRDPTIEPVISTASATRLGHGLARNLFGKLGVSQIFFDDPLNRTVYQKIRDAEVKADEVNNRLWYGVAQRGDWDKKNFIQRMSKVKLEASAYWQTKNANNLDLADVHDVFKQGFEQGLDYAANKAQNGAHLTQKQAKLYDTLAQLYKNQYLEITNVEKALGKENIMQERPGWYPAVRAGQFFVDISFNGRTLHREQFRSKTEADHFRSILKQRGTQHLVVSDAQHIKDNQQISDMYGGIELAQRILEQKFPAAQGAIRTTIQQALQQVMAKGGKLGSHHQYRSNLSGYRGSELFYDKAEKGNSFRAAIQQSVNDYSGGLRKMIIQHTVDPILKAQGLDPNAPNVLTAQQMVDSALNRVSPNAFEKIDRSIIEGWDKTAKKLFKEISPNQKGSFESFNGSLLEFFYLTKLMSKIVFPIGQILTIGTAIRELSVEGGYLRPYLSMGKAVAKLAYGDKTLKNVLFDVSQTTNTFEPQFVEAMHLGHGGSLVEGIKDYVLLRKVNEAADSFSRLTVFSAAFEMYKDLGLSTQDAKRKAMDDANKTMVPYGRTETAPIFNRMGIIGQAMKPLQTFGQQQLANWIHDFRYMKANDAKTWAPMLNYMLVTTALGGAMSPIFIQEYEMFRKMLENFFPEWAPPGILELAKNNPDFLDRMEVDQDMVKKAALYGIPAATTGVDVASSTRANMTFLSLVGSVLTGEENFGQLMPHLGTAAGVVSGLATGVKALFGGNVTNEETKKAITNVMPSGAASYGAREYVGVNEAAIKGDGTGMTAGGKGNTAQVPRGTTEKVAGYMGTKSTEEKFKSDQARFIAAKDVINKQRIEKLYDVFMDTPKTDTKKNQEILQKLVDLGQDGKAIQNKLGTEMYHRYMPQLERMFINKNGKVGKDMATARKVQEYGEFNRR